MKGTCTVSNFGDVSYDTCVKILAKLNTYLLLNCTELVAIVGEKRKVMSVRNIHTLWVASFKKRPKFDPIPVWEPATEMNPILAPTQWAC